MLSAQSREENLKVKQFTNIAHRFWWLIPTVIYLYAFATALVLGFAYLPALSHLEAGSGTLPGYSILFDHEQSFSSLLSLWDGQWYRDIVERGYNVNYDLSSRELVNLAFFPLFPLLVKLLTMIGLPFWLAGSLINIVFTLASFVLLFRIAYRYSGSLWLASFAILPLILNPAFFITLSTYTEGLGLFVVSLILHGLVNSRYRWVISGLLIAAVTRGIGVPLFALVFVVVAVHFWKERKLELRHYAALAAGLFAAGFWPLFVGITLESPTASLEILSFWTTSTKYPLWIIPVAGAGVYILHRLSKSLPWQWQLWSVFYALYIVSTTVMSFGIIRYGLLALLPLPLFFELISPRMRAKLYPLLLLTILALSFCCQAWWLSSVWIPASSSYIGGYAIP